MEGLENEINEELETMFSEVTEKMKLLVDLSNETRLKIYGLFKVATEGKYDVNKDKEIGFFDFEKKYKYESWKRCSKYSMSEAKIEYVKLYYSLTGESEIKITDTERLFDDKELQEMQLEVGSSHQFSSNAKQAQLEIKQYLESATNDECVFQEIQDHFRDCNQIHKDYFKTYSHIKRKYFYNSTTNKRSNGSDTYPLCSRLHELLCFEGSH